MLHAKSIQPHNKTMLLYNTIQFSHQVQIMNENGKSFRKKHQQNNKMHACKHSILVQKCHNNKFLN